MKHIPNMLSGLRILCAVALFFTEVFSLCFFALYMICGVSDVLDGYIARKTGSESRMGEMLDSIADFIFIGIIMIKFLSRIQWSVWMLVWLLAVAIIRFVSLGVGFYKYHTLAFLHTYANKLTGVLIFLAPILYCVMPLSVLAGIVLSLALLSAVEELLINLSTKTLDRNRKSIIN